MSLTPEQMQSPRSIIDDLGKHGLPGYKPLPSALKMVSINSLLNPSASECTRLHDASSASPPSTPAYTADDSCSTMSPSRPDTPSTPSSTKQENPAKDATVLTPGVPKDPVNYPPWEGTDGHDCLETIDQEELARQHKLFKIPSSAHKVQGVIADYPRHIPYASEKKAFYGKTKRNGFEVFQYTFRVPGDPGKITYVVMWDYQIGLVRITPFFKALKYSKTTPAKAVTTNAGLKELSHSITGGSLAAQGYWMPYLCARAICLTFCYDIRWALTPIFGPEFVKECLRPEQSGYGGFKISREVVKRAQRDTEGWRTLRNSRRPTSTRNRAGDGVKETPRSVPCSVPGAQLRVLTDHPMFKEGSPFQPDYEGSSTWNTNHHSTSTSPKLSPKSQYRKPDAVAPTSPWENGDRPYRNKASSSSLNNAFVESFSLPMLRQQRHVQTTPWRSLNHDVSKPVTLKLLNRAPNQRRVHKQRVSTLSDIDGHSSDRFTSGNASPGDDVDLGPISKKRKLPEDTPTPLTDDSTLLPRRKIVKSKRYTAADARAARWLLNLSARDSALAFGPPERTE